MVAEFLQNDCTTQDSSTYKAALDGNAAVLSRLGRMFAPHQSNPAAMTITIDAGALLQPDGSVASQAAQTSGTITAPSGNPRIDLAVVDLQTGALSIVTGSEAASPSAPACPAGKMPVAQIPLSVGQSSIINPNLIDVRVPSVVPTPYLVGEVKIYGGAAAPSGWLLCDGSAKSRATYAALFAVLGTTFGAGDGSTTFNLPDMRGRVPMGAGQGNTAEGGGTGTNRILGVIGGAETHTLTVTEMPPHKHNSLSGAPFISDTTGGAIGTGGTYGADEATTSEVGGGGAHTVMNPFAVVNFIIKY